MSFILQIPKGMNYTLQFLRIHKAHIIISIKKNKKKGEKENGNYKRS